MRAPWLGDVLRDAGLTVATPAGNPVGHGRDMDTIYGVVGHDTVTSQAWADLSVARMLRNGHANLSGPLYQLGVRRNGTVDWIADGRCNHNGHGLWGNDAIGIGVYCNGGANPNEPWNLQQRDTVVVATRAILDHLGLGPSSYFNPRLAGHKETDQGRKQDPFGIDMAAVRRDVDLLAQIPDEDDDMTPEQAKLIADTAAAVSRIEQTLEGRNVGDDLARLRRSVRQIGVKLGIPVRDGLEPTGEVDA